MTESVYIDTSVVSYLTARPALDVVTAARQIETMEWWTIQSPHFELFSSDTVVEEARQIILKLPRDAWRFYEN